MALIKETVVNILNDHALRLVALDNTDVDEIVVKGFAANEEIVAYFTDSDVQWDVYCCDWPNMEGGESFAAWIEDGILYTIAWSYIHSEV